MEKVERFKRLCRELQKRKLDLDKEVNKRPWRHSLRRMMR